MPNRSKQKGYRRERMIVDLHLALGCHAKRVPLSGAAEGFKGDVIINTPSGKVGMQGEVKARANGEGFATLERWLGTNDCLFLIRDRSDPMVVVPWSVWMKLMEAA